MLTINLTQLCLHREPQRLQLSYDEAELLRAMNEARQHTLSRSEIAEILGRNELYYDARALEKCVSRLRLKIAHTFGCKLIVSVRGHGYRLSQSLSH
ncbi:DNA-binding transcriptional activator CusR [compost metagenome]